MRSLITYFIAVIVTLSSCIKDKSNYDYTDSEIITVKGMESSYTVISEKDHLKITPSEISSNKPGADFDYLWGIYETNVTGAIPVLDTLAKTRDLDYAVNKPAKGWVLVYRVTNKNTGYSKYFTSSISIVTEFTRGWYIAKDDGTNADLDLFLTSASIVPDSKRENIYSQINGAKMPGKANLLSFLTSYKSMVTGTLANTRTLVMTTDKDAATMNINTLKNIYTGNELFLDPPAAKGPCYIFPGSSAYYLLNNGRVHVIVTNSSNIGKFGETLMRDVNNSPYKLSKYNMVNTLSNGYFFDETSSSFVGSQTGYGTSLSDLANVAGTDMNAKNTNKNLIYMGLKTSRYLPAPDYRYAFTACAILQDKADPSIKILSDIALDQLTAKFTNKTILPTDKLYNGTLFSLPMNQEDIMYFVLNGNEVWSRNLSNGFEKLEYSAPAGEQISFVRHKAGGDAGYSHNFIIIGTSVGGNYKIRMFNKGSGSITGNPVVTLEGTGTAKDVLYIYPTVSESTYTIQW